MRHAIGFSDQERFPLKPYGRIKFDTSNFHSMGYFELLSTPFDRYAHRDAHASISLINVLFVLKGNDLIEALQLLQELEAKVSAQPEAWREFLGTCHPPRGAPVIRIEPLLFKGRALSLISKLRSTIQYAQSNGLGVVYGNGVCYRHLLGIKLPPGTEEYS